MATTASAQTDPAPTTTATTPASPTAPYGAPTGPVPQRPTSRLSWVGMLVAPTSARVAPSPSARVVTTLQPIAPLGGGITVLAITDRRRGSDGRLWVRVRLPVRPNGSQGWMPADALRMRTTPIRVTIDVGDRQLTLYRSGRAIMKIPVAVGAVGTPTPLGQFAVAEMIRTHHPGGFLGPVVFPLTGFSETLNEYAGGNGRVAMHGTSLPELIGTRASHGCIRINNRQVNLLARFVRPGVPVLIRA